MANAVNEEFLRRFKTGDLVDVKTKHFTWSGPHKLLVYKFDPPSKRLVCLTRMTGAPLR
jgi:hypothetical protein